MLNRLTRSALRWITLSSPAAERGTAFFSTRHCEVRSNLYVGRSNMHNCSVQYRDY